MATSTKSLSDHGESESMAQIKTVAWFRKTYPGVKIFAIPNGGRRSPSEALRLKNEGVSAGVPDLFVPEWGLWIEMKKETGGKVSPAQSEWLGYLEEIGHTAIVCPGFDAAKTAICAFSAQQHY